MQLQLGAIMSGLGGWGGWTFNGVLGPPNIRQIGMGVYEHHIMYTNEIKPRISLILDYGFS